MKKELVLKLEIKRPDGRFEEMVVHSTRVLVGTGAHCDVRIGGEGAAKVHLVLDLVAGKLCGEAKHLSPPPYRDGKPFFEGALGTSAELAVAGTRLRVSIVEAPTQERRGRTKRLVTSTVLALAVVALPGVVYAALRQEAEPPIGPPPSEVTALFDTTPAGCSASAVDQASSAGATARAVAEQQREQHPFAVADGLAAVRSFDSAATCFGIAGQRSEQAAMASARDGLRTRIEDDYRVHRVRVEHSIEEGDEKTALHEVRVLRRLTAGRHGAYVSWLEMVERRLDTAVRTAAASS